MSHCIEEKHLLNGAIKQYDCELIHFSNHYGVLRYVVPEDHKVADLILPAGTMTYGYYWLGQPFSIYDWYHQGKHLGSYFSIIDRLRLNPACFSYRDLVVDMLIDTRLNIRVLDYDELPQDCESMLLDYILEAAELILGNYTEFVEQVTTQSRSYLNTAHK